MAIQKKSGSKKTAPPKKTAKADNSEVLKAFAEAFTSRQVKSKSKPGTKAIEDKQIESNIKFSSPSKDIASTVSTVDLKSTTLSKLPQDVKKSIQSLKDSSKKISRC